MEILCIEKRVYSGRPGSFNCFTSSFILVSQFGEVEFFRYFHMQVIYDSDVVGNSIKPVTRHFCRIWISIFTQCVLYMWDFNSSTVDDACQAPHCCHSERWTLFRLRARHDIGVVMISMPKEFTSVGTSWAQILIFNKNSCAGLRRSRK